MIYYELDEKEKELIKDIQEITITDYEVKNNLIKVDNLISIIQDLKCEVGNLQEEIENLNNDINDNYRRITVAEQLDL